MGGARNRSFISAHFLLSAYFLAAQTYKCMRLITRVYGITGLSLKDEPRDFGQLYSSNEDIAHTTHVPKI